MKKILTAVITIMLAAILLAGCVSIRVNSQESLPRSAAPATAPKELTRGTLEDNVYTSDFNGITFTAPEGWMYLPDDFLAKQSGMSMDEFPEPGSKCSGEALKDSTFYDMDVFDINSKTEVIITYDNLALSKEGAGISIDQFIDNEKGLIAAGGLEFREVNDTELCGSTYKTLTIITPEKQLVQYEYFRRIDNYMLVIVVSVFSEDDIADVMACFS